MGVHDGHRARVRQRVLREGLSHLEPHNVLEILLFFSIPRGDTNELAHRILDRYNGDLAAVTSAPVEELLTIEGVGENTAFMLKMIPEIAAYYRKSLVKDGVLLDSTEAIREYMVPKFYGKTREELHFITLDGEMRPISDTVISTGSATSSTVDIKRMVEIAISSRATWCMMAHNHPSGMIRPSQRDASATKEAATALRLVGVGLTDHLIIAGEAMFSMRDSGIMPDGRL
ncbi:MAG: RadC family protein [Oscillospiraceae bacterium]|nr:RadC family protein [Oscillospiraceae bacterium]